MLCPEFLVLGDLTEVGRTRPERTMSGVVRGWMSLPSPWEVGCGGGESGRNELLRGPFALFGVRIGMLSSKRPR